MAFLPQAPKHLGAALQTALSDTRSKDSSPIANSDSEDVPRLELGYLGWRLLQLGEPFLSRDQEKNLLTEH